MIFWYFTKMFFIHMTLTHCLCLDLVESTFIIYILVKFSCHTKNYHLENCNPNAIIKKFGQKTIKSCMRITKWTMANDVFALFNVQVDKKTFLIAHSVCLKTMNSLNNFVLNKITQKYR